MMPFRQGGSLTFNPVTIIEGNINKIEVANIYLIQLVYLYTYVYIYICSVTLTPDIYFSIFFGKGLVYSNPCVEICQDFQLGHGLHTLQALLNSRDSAEGKVKTGQFTDSTRENGDFTKKHGDLPRKNHGKTG
jgi:hypothetical protein